MATGIISVAPGTNTGSHAIAAGNAKLPKDVRPFVLKLRTEHSIADAMQSALFERKRTLSAERTELRLQLSHFQRELDHNLFESTVGPESHRKAIAQVQTEIDAKDAEIGEVDAESARSRSVFNPAPIDSWLVKHVGKSFRSARPEVKLAKGQTLEEALAETREKRSATIQEADAIDNADLPYADALRRATTEIDQVAAKGEPFFGATRRTQSVDGRLRYGKVRWPTRVDEQNREHPDAFALLVFLNKDALKAAAKEQLAKLESASAVPVKDRPARVAEIRERARKLEYLEGAIIQRLYAEGKRPGIRSDMDAGALLGLEPFDASAPKPTPESEPEETPEQMARDVRRARLRDMQKSAPRMSPKAESEFG
jgi:hypothetical protein